jgi:hypothetical protein
VKLPCSITLVKMRSWRRVMLRSRLVVIRQSY